MEFSYGDGEYIERDKRVKGQIILAEHKLFLKGPQGDLTQTYVPLEKIEKVKKTFNGLEVYVRPALAMQYVALIKGAGKKIDELTNDIVSRRGFKKKFLRKEWVENV